MSPVGFAAPWLLLLLVPVTGLLVAYLVQQRRRTRYAVRFASLPMLQRVASARPGWRRHLPAALLLVAFALLALAVARPQAEVRVPRETATVVVAVDVSLSMQATDVEPNRLEAARVAATEFVEGLPDGFGVAVVAFSGQVAVLAPADAERSQAVDALQQLTLSESTAIGEGVFTSLAQVEQQSERAGREVPAHIVLISDGTNTVGRSPEQAAAAAVEAGVPVSTIAYGTPNGAVEVEGQLVPVPVDEASLARLAESARGTAYVARTGDELSQVYDDIGSSIGWTTEEREVTTWVATLALLLGLLAAGLSLRWFSRLP